MKQTPNTRTGWKSGAEVVIGVKDKEVLTSFINNYLGVDTSQLIVEYETLFYKIKRSEGTLQAVKKCKQYYDVALRYSCNLKFAPIPFCKSNKAGFPKVLKTFAPYLRGNLASKRASLTILQLYKLIDCRGDFSTDSITRKYLGSTSPWWLESFDKILEEEFPPGEIQKRIDSLKPGLHVSGKKGPNGPALITSPIDREAIRQDKRLESAIYNLAKITNNGYLKRVLDESLEEPEEKPYHHRRSLEHSQIRIKYESGGKARAFCVVDYFSQSALFPIHNFLMDWLYRNNCDGTRNHSDAAEAVREWSDGRYGHNVWSFDLTTATDRYPRFLEKRVLEAVFGKEIADNWETVISSRSFRLPKGDGRVAFAAGQPLGALSSWASFAVTHHIHIRTASYLAKVKKPLYRIIGDDIAIARDLRVAQLYIDMMSDLNVPFSETKSILPQQMEGEPCVELAKRLFCNGTEVTPIPPEAILEEFKTPIGVKNLIEIAIRRGYDKASMIYPVQSSIPSQGWLPTITFPIRNRLPQLNEVKLFRPFWEDVDESPPAGLNREWFVWSDFSDDELNYFLRELLLSEVMRAYYKSIRFRNTLYEWSLIGPDSEVEGGDWQPELWNIHDFMLPAIVDYMTEKLEETIEDIQTTPSFDDVYMYISGLHSFLEPRQAFIPRSFDDEKKKTKVFMTSLIRNIREITLSVDPITTLTRMCDIESLDTIDP